MQISPVDPITQTYVFVVLLFGILLLSCVKRTDDASLFPHWLTNELKGFAMLAIVLSHIGYFLSTDTRFLFPWSVAAGVGVDIFLFLSGFGLTLSSYKEQLAPLAFYKKRLLRLLIPLWTVLVLFFIADASVLHRTYPLSVIIPSFFGIFRTADLFHDLNSPLWYITWTLWYYLLFPWLFRRDAPWRSAVLLFSFGFAFVMSDVQFFSGVTHLYRLHTLAFPLGVVLAGCIARPSEWMRHISTGVARWRKQVPPFWFTEIRLCVAIAAAVLFGYFALHSAVGGGALQEQLGTVATAALVVITFVTIQFRIRLLELFGVYSYEVYLLHWPLLYRYDLLYHYLPAGIATILYLVLFVALGYVMQKGIGKLYGK